MNKAAMKLLLAWFLFIFCTHALSTMALPRFFNLEEHEQEIHVRRLHTVELYGEKYNDQMDDSRKNQRGKTGVYGGANVAHRPRQGEKSSAPPSLLARPQLQPFLITKTILQVTFALLLILPFQLP